MTYLAVPNGFGFATGTAGAILGEESGLGEAEPLPDLGRSSSFFRARTGVGGVELLAVEGVA